MKQNNPTSPAFRKRTHRPNFKIQTSNFSERRVTKGNYAFIDSQNVNRGIQSQGWNLDWKLFRDFLRTQLGVSKALLFIGYIAGNDALYADLRHAGFEIVFKPTTTIRKGNKTTIKGNVDTDLVLHALLEREHYQGAVIASGDGDFHSLATHLNQSGKLKGLVVPDQKHYSHLLNDFQPRIVPMSGLRSRLERKKRRHA